MPLARLLSVAGLPCVNISILYMISVGRLGTNDSIVRLLRVDIGPITTPRTTPSRSYVVGQVKFVESHRTEGNSMGTRRAQGAV